MPKIVQYTAPETKITPSDLGFSAWETAGRRIGPLYNEAAEDIKTGGQLQAKEIENQGWVLPFDRFRKFGESGRGQCLRIQNHRQGGGGGGRAGLRMSPQGTNEASIGAPFLSGVAAHAAGKGKPMPNPEEEDQQAINDAANQWYYGSGPNSASGVYGGEGVSTDQYGSVSVPTGVNATTGYDEYGNPLAADAGIPYAPATAPQDQSLWDNVSSAASNFGGWVSNFLGGGGGSSGGSSSGGGSSVSTDNSGGDDFTDDNVPMD